MRYFEIAKPPVRYRLSRRQPERNRSGTTTQWHDRNRWRAVSVELVKQNQSAVTSMAFITPAFAIAQGNVCPRNGPQPTFSSIIRQTISDACCQSASDGSSVVAMVTSASPEFRTVM